MNSAPRISLEDILLGFCVGPTAPMRDVLQVIDRNGEGVALVVDGERRLLGIVTDGDIRRATLSGQDFSRSVAEFLRHKSAARGPRTPLAAGLNEDQGEWRKLMDESGVRHLPLLDENGRLAGLALMSALVRDEELPLRAVVMAGGFGVRLRPLTSGTPKPLLPIGKKPLIEHIVSQLRDSGVRRVSITTHFHGEKIRGHFGDGSAFGVQMQYTEEKEPLGTAGALSMLRGMKEPLLVINGDILTAVDFRAMLAFHRELGSELTVGVRRYEVPVPFGVIEADGPRVTGLKEKPSLSFFINAGIYILEPAVVDSIPEGRRIDMTDLIDELLRAGRVVSSFPIHEYWIDIGQVEDYLKATEDAASGRLKG